MSDRHTGVGFDQLLSVEPPTDPDSDFRYRIYNADGSEAEQCGNGARCFAKFVVDNGSVGENGAASADEQRRASRRSCAMTVMVEVDMGVPTHRAGTNSVRHRRSRRHAIGSPSAIRTLRRRAGLGRQSARGAVRRFGQRRAGRNAWTAAGAPRTVPARRQRRLLSGDRRRLRAVARVRTRRRRNARVRHRCMRGRGRRRADRAVRRTRENFAAGRQSQNQMGRARANRCRCSGPPVSSTKDASTYESRSRGR